ncbi:MAG TPA: amidohydrolase family protein, partial [Caulobacteraceae bacterium]
PTHMPAPPAPDESDPSEPGVIYSGATLVDPASGTLLPNVTIAIRGERVLEVLPGALVKPHPGFRTVDVKGLYVSPGLVNSHEHLATPPDRPFAEAMMRRDLYGGVTAVRDMADDLRQLADLTRASRVGEIPGPDLYYAALMAGPEFFDDPRTHATTRGAIAGQAPWMQAVTHQTDLPLAIARAAGTGATAIKIYADLPPDLVAAITREAHRQGLRVWAHAAVFPASPAEVLDAGVDSVSHVCMLAYQASAAMPHAYHPRPAVEDDKFAGGDNPVVQRLFDQIRSQGVILDATLWIYPEMASDHAANPGSPAPYCSAPLAYKLANEAYRSGDLMVTGTDGFSPSADPWPAIDEEMILLQDKAGMKPADVVKAATVNGATVIGQGRDMGVIDSGRLADLVFTREDPLKDVRAFRTVVLTIKRGHEYWRKDYKPVTADEMKGEE